jgi:hypothetical protein
MTVSYEHPAGALEPPMALELRQPATVGEANARRESDGSYTKPMDLTNAIAVTALVYAIGTDNVLDFSLSTAFVDRKAGAVDVIWQPGDPIETPGVYRVVTSILWPGNRPQLVPQRREDAFALRVVEQAPF